MSNKYDPDEQVEELSWEAAEPVETVEAAEVTAVEPVQSPVMSLADTITYAEIAIASDNYKDLSNKEQAVIRILAGRELGLGVVASLQGLYVIEGKVSMGSALVASLIKSSNKYVYRELEHTDDVCVLAFFENGEQIGVSSFSMADAEQAGITRGGSGWSKYPKNMLFARALTNGARFYCPDVFHGAVYTPEELGNGSLGDTQGSETYSYTPTPPKKEEAVCPWHFNHAGSMEEANGEVRFFKKGNMRGYAHPMGEGQGWCNYDDVEQGIQDEAVSAMLEAGQTRDTFRSAVGLAFPELADVEIADFRLEDWAGITDHFGNLEGEKNAKSEKDETSQDSLPGM